MNRIFTRVITGALTGAVLALGVATPASAAPLPDPNPILDLIPGVDCGTPPTPGNPNSGVAGVIDSGPSNPSGVDPFTDTSTANAYQVYGWGGLGWVDYDAECIDTPRLIPPVVSQAFGAIANGIMHVTVFMSALTVEITRVSFDPTTLGVLDPVFEGLIGVTGGELWVGVGWIGVVIAAIVLLWIVRLGKLSVVMTQAVTTFGLMLLAAAVVAYPLAVAATADRFVVGVLAGVNDAATGTLGPDDLTQADLPDSLGGSLHEGILYNTWLSGNFGRADSETAARFGPELYNASTLTWDETREIQEDPDARDRIVDAKQAQYRVVVDEIERADPEAYAYLTGQRNLERAGFALLGLIAYTAAGGFLLFSGFLLLVAFMLLRVVNVLLPALICVAVIPGLRGYVGGPVTYALTVLVHAFKFALITIFLVVIMGYLLSPGTGISYVVTIAVIAGVSIAGWKLGKPFKTLTVLSPLRRQTGDTYQRVRDRDWGSVFTRNTPAGDRAPAETAATTRGGVFVSAAKGAATGAAVGALGAAATSGASVVAGAIGGAVTGAVTQIAGPTAGTVAGTLATSRAHQGGATKASAPPATPTTAPDSTPWVAASDGTVTPVASPPAPAAPSGGTRTRERAAEATAERARWNRSNQVFVWGPRDPLAPDTSHLPPQRPVFSRRVEDPHPIYTGPDKETTS